MCRGPKKWNILLREVKQRSCNGGEILNKPSIKIAETQESLDMLDSTWNRPICNAFDLSRVHTYLSFRNDDAEVFNRRLHERALLALSISHAFLVERGPHGIGCQGVVDLLQISRC